MDQDKVPLITDRYHKWLQKQLKAHKAHRVQDVFLMTVDRGGSVVLAKKESVK